ncbi:lysophospholipid acyltransferase family protein [Isoalcanivorax indicus]|uniref:lysophospholipid acyltransferase family protein n=1 Tax=Isoalcanivorax indicus TaxID=2202653 RepID=UPI000DB9528B|nr:lysophospholipid acyltransferase family protein [Isoalcanivorax indicus]
MPRLVYTLYIWLAFMPIMMLVTLILGIACLATAPLIGPRRAGRLYAVPWSRIGLALCGVSVRIEGSHHIRPGQSYVVVANHLSHIDIWVLYGYLGMDIRWVAKQEVRRIPVVGISCVALGHIFIDRSHPDRAIASLNAAKRQIAGGTSILFFPEGTRSRDGTLHPFKKGAFRMAADLDLPVLPVSLTGTRAALPPDTLRFSPAHISMNILPPLTARDASDQAVEALLQESHERIATATGQRELTACPH